MSLNVPCTAWFLQYTVRIHLHIANTVKPVYNGHSRDPVLVVFVDRWSLYRGALVSLRWSMEQPTVVSVDRWSFYTSGL